MKITQWTKKICKLVGTVSFGLVALGLNPLSVSAYQASVQRVAGPYQAGWRRVTISRTDNSTFQAVLFYPATSAGQNAPYQGSGAPYPAISFGHGFFMTPMEYRSTLEHLATWGYFVIATESESGFFVDFPRYIDDLLYSLTYLENEHQRSASWLFGQVDTQHFGLSGHSMGGGASILAAAGDPRVKAVANLAASDDDPSPIDAMPDVTVPISLIAGSQDGLAPVEENGQLMYDNGGPARQLPIIQGGYHCGFMDQDIFGCDSGSLAHATQLEITRQMLTDFFDLYLKGDQNAWRRVWGPEAYSDPLVALQADPGIALVLSSQTGSGFPGDTVTYELTLTNTGRQATAYDLFIEDQNWQVDLSTAQTEVLNPGDQATVQLSVTVPGSGADQDQALVSARAVSDGATRSYMQLITRRVLTWQVALPFVMR